MSKVADYAAFLWIPFVSALSAIVVIFFIAWLVRREVKDPEIRAYVGRAVFILTILVIAGFGYAAFQTAAVHLPRTTIDRSLGDEQQQALERRIYEGEKK